jgi:hypothetical protein
MKAFSLLAWFCLLSPLAQTQTFAPGENEVTGLFGTRVTGRDRGEAAIIGGAYRRRIFRNWVAVGEGARWQKIASEDDLFNLDETGGIFYDGFQVHGGVERYISVLPSIAAYAGTGFGGFVGTRFDASGEFDIRQYYYLISGGMRWVRGAESRWALRADYRFHKPFSRFETERTWYSTASAGVSIRIW